MKLRLLKKTTSTGCAVFYFQVLRKTWFGERWRNCFLESGKPFVRYSDFSYVTKEAAEKDLEETRSAKKFLAQPYEVVGEYEL